MSSFLFTSSTCPVDTTTGCTPLVVSRYASPGPPSIGLPALEVFMVSVMDPGEVHREHHLGGILHSSAASTDFHGIEAQCCLSMLESS